MNPFVHRMLGHFLLNEAGAEGGEGGAAPAATDAPAIDPAADPAAADPSAAPADPAKPTDPAKPAAQGAPEAYSEFTFGDGFELDSAVLTDFQTLAKELNLNQEGAQKLIDLQTKLEEGRTSSTQQALQTQAEAWAK